METPPPLVLVIDGDGLTVAALERHLLKVGFRVATANTAASGVRAYARSPAEVVLCASTLPDSDGLSVQRALNALPGSTAFVLIATNAQPTVVAEAFRNHAADVLIAPFDSKELGATLERAMATRPRGALPAAPPPMVTDSPRPGATIAWSLAPDPSAGIVRRPSLHRITSWPRIVEILRHAARGRRGSMLLDGSDAKIEVQLSALTANSSRGYSGALALEVSRQIPQPVADRLAPLVGHVRHFVHRHRRRRSRLSDAFTLHTVNNLNSPCTVLRSGAVFMVKVEQGCKHGSFDLWRADGDGLVLGSRGT
jgi:CheY-like chemotaxis protein